MAISSSTRKAGPFLGNDATTVFPFAFKVFTSADLRVVRTNALGVESDLVLDTDYTVTLNSNQDNDPGGTVTRATALPTGERLTITSDVEALQPLVLTNNGGFYPRVINDAFDKITIIAQQLIEQVGRSLKLPISSTASATLPDPVANRLIAWNSSANGFTNVDPASIATVAAYADANLELFDGNGTQTAFTLAEDPAVLANLDVSISGVTQVGGEDFTWIGTTLTFLVAPPNGTRIQVRYTRAIPPADLAAAVAAAEADRVATAADRVQTGLDRVATAADVVSAEADRVATAADRVQTGLDAVATAADRAQTGLDRVQTGADVATASSILASRQPLDADLTAIAALTSAADKMPYATGAQTWALTDLTAAARSVLDDTTTAAMLDTLGVPTYGTKALAAAATILAEVKSLQTLAYATPSVGGGARYVRTSYATITAAAYPASAYLRSVDRFMPDGSTDATNGGYWLISEPFFYPEQFGAVGDDSTIDTTPWRDMVATSPEGGVIRFRVGGRYRIDDDIVIDKPISIYGGGSGTYDGQLGTFIRQITPGENVFTLKARLANYLYGQYALVGCLFDSINFLGATGGGIQLPANRAAAAIGSDTAVNAGDYHLREIDLRNCVIQNFTRPLNLVGIVYLWDFYSVKWRFCTEALTITKGASSQVGGQLRFFGCSGTQCDDYIFSIFMDTMGGSLSLFGCTISESLGGVKVNEELTLVMSGCEVESHIDGGDGVGLYIPITDPVNPNTSAPKIITGCKFLTNDVDIWIDKTTTAFSGGTFAWPMTMDANYFSAATALRITVPVGHAGIISQQFVLGPSNSGTNNGLVADSQISANFLGVDQRKINYSRVRTLSNGLPIVYSGAAGSTPVLVTMTVPNGSTLYLEDVERFSMNPTTNVRGSCSLDLIDSAGGTLIGAFGNGYVASLTWLNSTGLSQNVRLTASDGGSGNPYYVQALVRVA